MSFQETVGPRRFAITFGEVSVLHVGGKEFGTRNDLDHGFTVEELESFHDLNPNTDIYRLSDRLPEAIRKDNQAVVLVIRNGVDSILESDMGSNYLYNEQLSVPYNKMFWNSRQKKTMHKRARYNVVFGQEYIKHSADYQQPTVIAFDSVPGLNSLRERLPYFFGDKAKNLNAEGNYYYEEKSGIGFHGDTERKIVIGVSLGHSTILRFQWRMPSSSTGYAQPIDIEIRHGDIYIMSEKATGYDWKKRSLVRVVHAAGSEKYITHKMTDTTNAETQTGSGTKSNNVPFYKGRSCSHKKTKKYPNAWTLKELKAEAKRLGLSGYSTKNKAQLCQMLNATSIEQLREGLEQVSEGLEEGEGLVEGEGLEEVGEGLVGGILDRNVLRQIALKMDVKTLGRYCQASKRIAEICQDEEFWRLKLLQDYGIENKTEYQTWERLYKYYSKRPLVNMGLIPPRVEINPEDVHVGDYFSQSNVFGDQESWRVEEIINVGKTKKLYRISTPSKPEHGRKNRYYSVIGPRIIKGQQIFVTYKQNEKGRWVISNKRELYKNFYYKGVRDPGNFYYKNIRMHT